MRKGQEGGDSVPELSRVKHDEEVFRLVLVNRERVV
jgi:hypothetical protein